MGLVYDAGRWGVLRMRLLSYRALLSLESPSADASPARLTCVCAWPVIHSRN